MREIKFRAQALYGHGEWVFGHLSRKWDNWFITDDDGTATLIDIDSAGQFTGLKDRNDQDIYENDLVTHEEDGETWGASQVVFENGMFCFNGDYPNYLALYEDLEVIGTIQETPHLLNGFKD